MENSIYFSIDKLGSGDKLGFNFNGAKDHLVGSPASDILDSNDTRSDVASPQIEECSKQITRLNGIKDTTECSNKARQCHLISLAPLEKLNNFDTGRLKRSIGVKRTKECNNHNSIEARKMGTRKSEKLSAEEIMRLAGELLLQSYSQTVGGFSDFTQPCHLSFSGLSEQDLKNAQLAQFLLVAAEKISERQYEGAKRWLDRCDSYSNDTGNPVERVVYYFSEALHERMDRETGRVSDKGLGKKHLMNIREALMKNLSSVTASYQETPFSKIIQFVGTQAIIENVIESKKIHIIDLGFRFDSPWMILMEALATRCDLQLELLKITAVGTICNTADMVEETGKRLVKFAESKNLPFCYKSVLVSDFLDLKEELLEIESDETVAVFSNYGLRSMLRFPNRLEHVMGIIAMIAPVVTVIVEADANHNSPVFEDRFMEALFFFSAYFDYLGECLSNDEKNRRIMEAALLGEWIRNMVATEGEERKITNVKIQVWRAFIERYGLKEVQFSMLSLYQANLLLKGWRRHCTLEMNGKGLLVCWKGVPIHFASIWKFS